MESASGRKILFVITVSDWGGAQSYVFDLATALQASGWQVSLATGGEGLLVSRLKEAGVRVIGLPGLTRDVAMLEDEEALVAPKAVTDSVRQEIMLLPKLVKLFREERPDVLHLNSSKAGGLGALAARLAGVKRIVFTAHGWPHKEPRPFLVKALIWFLSWLTIILSHKVIAVSEDDVALAPVFFSKRKIVRVHNGIESFELLSREDARKELRLPESARVILSVAELTTNKGIDTAIDAFAEIANEHPGWIYAVVGEGSRRKELEARIKHYGLESRILLLGFQKDARRFLKAADLFLLPSRKEGLPLALLEAGIARLPVVASRVGGIPEIVRNKETGFLVPPHNPHALARTLRSVLEHPEDWQRYGEMLERKVRERFSKERMVEETLDIYKG